MLAVADEEALYLLEFVDRRGLEKEIERLRRKTKQPIIPGKTDPIQQIEIELEAYFSGKLQQFKTPVFLMGSPFQKRVWEALRKIPAGETRSYAEIAKATGQPSAVRAVGLANGSNQLAIIIPCHRVIRSDGGMGHYTPDPSLKRQLLHFEGAAFIEESFCSSAGVC